MNQPQPKPKRPEPKEFLRLLIPVERLDHKQRKRAVALGDRIETKFAGMLARGADPDRLMDALEGYFPE